MSEPTETLMGVWVQGPSKHLVKVHAFRSPMEFAHCLSVELARTRQPGFRVLAMRETWRGNVLEKTEEITERT